MSLDNLPDKVESVIHQPLKVIGEPAQSGGIKVDLLNTSTAASISLNRSGHREGTPNYQLTNVPADDGGKYVILEGKVTNNGQASLDLSCSAPVRTGLFDKRDREFDEIPELHLLPGNPECNVGLQPGFSTPMTWVYLIPNDATPVAWRFLDLTVTPEPLSAGFALSS